MGIAIEPDPDTNTPGDTDERTRRELTDRVVSHTALYGMLDNLQKVQGRDGILQVVEESLHILCDIRNCFCLLPEGRKTDFLPCCSSANPLFPRLVGFNWPTEESNSIIHRCLRDRAIQQITGDQHEGAMLSAVDHSLLELLECEAMLAIPVPISKESAGVLLTGLAPASPTALQQQLDTLLLLGAQAGTRLRQEELAREYAQQAARKQLEAVQEVTRHIAHEIASPLAVIQNYISVLNGATGIGGTGGPALRIISAEIDRIAAIVRQLGDLSTKGLPTTSRQEPLGQLTDDILTLFRGSLFHQRHIQTRLNIRPETREIEVPSETIRQVLTILLNNCAEALSDGGTVRVRSWLEPAPQSGATSQLALSVSDDGPGISAELLPSIFNAGITSKKGGHFGLGLSIAKKLLRDKDATLSHEQPENGGTRFVIRLPIRSQQLSASS